MKDILPHQIQPLSFFALVFALGISLLCGFWLGIVDRKHQREKKKARRERSSEAISSSIGHSSCQAVPYLSFNNPCLPLFFRPRDGNIFLLSQAPEYYTILVSYYFFNLVHNVNSVFTKLSPITLLRKSSASDRNIIPGSDLLYSNKAYSGI